MSEGTTRRREAGMGTRAPGSVEKLRRTLLGFDLLVPPTLTIGSGSLPSWTYEGRAELGIEPKSVRDDESAHDVGSPFDIPHDDTHRFRIVLVPHLDELGELVSRVRNIQLPRSRRSHYHPIVNQIYRRGEGVDIPGFRSIMSPM